MAYIVSKEYAVLSNTAKDIFNATSNNVMVVGGLISGSGITVSFPFWRSDGDCTSANTDDKARGNEDRG